jgi:hypothetical protein
MVELGDHNPGDAKTKVQIVEETNGLACGYEESQAPKQLWDVPSSKCQRVSQNS